MADLNEVTRRRRDPVRTRAAILDACLSALNDGDYFPTVKSLAARAGVSERSVFVHFADLDALRGAVTDRQSMQVEALVSGADPTAPLADRVDAIVRQFGGVFALQRRIRLVGLVESPTSAVVDERMRRTDDHLRERLGRTFAPELTRPDGTRDEQLLDLLEAVSGWAVHHHLMDRRDRSEPEVSATLRRNLLALLAPNR